MGLPWKLSVVTVIGAQSRVLIDCMTEAELIRKRVLRPIRARSHSTLIIIMMMMNSPGHRTEPRS